MGKQRTAREQDDGPPAPSVVSLAVAGGVRIAPDVAQGLADFAAEACDAIAAFTGRRTAAPSRIDVLIAGSGEIQRLNREFRRKNTPTDVISFPVAAPAGGAIEGDIAICCDIAADNAQRYGHDVAEELCILALHGMLHLAGYDHENDNGEMARVEADLRQALGLPASLIHRASNAGAAGKSSASRAARSRANKPPSPRGNSPAPRRRPRAKAKKAAR